MDIRCKAVEEEFRGAKRGSVRGSTTYLASVDVFCVLTPAEGVSDALVANFTIFSLRSIDPAWKLDSYGKHIAIGREDVHSLSR